MECMDCYWGGEVMGRGEYIPWIYKQRSDKGKISFAKYLELCSKEYQEPLQCINKYVMWLILVYEAHSDYKKTMANKITRV